MEFTIALGLGGWALLIAGAVVIGIAAQFIGEAHTGFEWIATGIGAFVGGLAASEFVVGWRTFQPVWDGVALVPAVVGGLVIGGIVALAARYLTNDTFAGRPMAT